jgi:hypothetical protein
MLMEILPDDVLLQIFDFCVDQGQDTKEEVHAWQPLVHVCRQWRIIVFGSPCRLNLRLLCAPKRHADTTLRIWPALPLLIQGSISSLSDALNTIIMLEYSDRIHKIELDISRSQLGGVLAAMQRPFPELTHLLLGASFDRYHDRTELVLPDLLLDGSAPRLRELTLHGIPFLELPRLLLSATHLVTLYLDKIPDFKIFSLEAMVIAVSKLTGLEILCLEFKYSLFRAFSNVQGRCPPPPTRSILPALARFTFRGVSRVLENLVARLNTPLLNTLSVTIFDEVNFDTPQLARFISHVPGFRANTEAKVLFTDGAVVIKLTSWTISEGWSNVTIQAEESVSSLAHICTPSFPPLSTLEHLYIDEFKDVDDDSDWEGNVEDTELSELLRPFIAVKKLYISKILALRIVSCLQNLVDGGMTEVLPALEDIFVEGLRQTGPAQECIGQFVAARQLSGHAITISPWDRD